MTECDIAGEFNNKCDTEDDTPNACDTSDNIYLLVGQGHQHPKNTNNPPILPSPINSEGTIVFPAPELLNTDIYMVGVPYFL